MQSKQVYRDALMGRLAELDSRLHKIEGALDEPHSKDWDDAAIEHENDEVLEQLGQSGQDEIVRIRAALATAARWQFRNLHPLWRADFCRASGYPA